MNMNDGYAAFISYRHKELDAAVAKAIHRQLETYRVPAYIAQRTGKKKLGKLFRDQDELPLMADLGEGIRRALEQSEWLIAICSPDFPQSKWCQAEIDYFIELGRRDRILTVLVRGEPDESFPTRLRYQETANGSVETEPLAADVRAASVSASLRKLRQEKLRLLAPMLGVGFDDLRRRARERFLRLAFSVAVAVAVFSAVFGGFALSQAHTIAGQNEELSLQKAKVYANFSREQLDNGNRAGAALLAFEALPTDPEDTPAQEAREVLYDAAYRSYPDVTPLAQVPSGPDIVPAPDGKTFVTRYSDCTRVYDAETFRLIYEHPGATTTVNAFDNGRQSGAEVPRAVYNRAGDRVFLPGGTPVLVDVRTGTVIREGFFTNADELADFGLSRYEIVSAGDSRHIVDLGTGETLFAAPTSSNTSKNLISPDGRWCVVVTYTVLSVYDIEERRQVAEVPSEMQSVTQGYTFFSPDSRYLVVTREAFETVLIAGLEEHRMVYTLQVLEIPSCRVIYESQVPDHAATTYAEHVLPNYYNGRASDLPANLFAPDSTKLLLPVSPTAFGVFDLEREEMLYTRRDELRFATFSPDSTRLLTLSRSGTTWTLREAASGVPTHSFYDIDTFFYRGFVWDGDTVLLAGNAGNSRFGGVYQLEKTVVNERSYFSDESGSYLKPAVGGALASVTSGQKTVALEGSADYDLTGLWAGAGAVAVGLSNKGTESVLTSWDAATGQVLARSLPAPELTYLSPSAPPSFALSADGSRVTAFYHNFGVEKGGFRTYDTVSGAVLAETGSFWLTDATLLFDRGVTRLLYIFDNTVTVYDCLSGAKLFTLDDYPEGENALGMWSGQVAAISDDGALLAISHSKKNTLEIIDTGAGTRLQEIPLSSAATTPPCFSHDGTRVTIGCGKTLLTAETSSGQVLYTIEDEDGFATAYKYSEDDLYLIGTDIRAADTGVTLCPTVLPAQPVTEINRALGVKIPVGYGHAVYLPSYGEALAALRACVREYTFTAAEKLRFSLD